MPDVAVQEKPKIDKNSEWYKENVLVADSFASIDLARAYKWPYTEIGGHIEGLAQEAKSRGKEILCINVKYCGTEDNHTLHHARCTAYLATGLCGHDKIEQCIKNLERWQVGPCYPRHDGDARMIIAITKKLKEQNND